jgi:hypothetical protein
MRSQQPLLLPLAGDISDIVLMHNGGR